MRGSPHCRRRGAETASDNPVAELKLGSWREAPAYDVPLLMRTDNGQGFVGREISKP